MLLSLTSVAQVDLGIGAAIGFPLMFNKKVNGHNQASGEPAARLSISYGPEDGTFAGILHVGIANTILPMVRFNNQQDVLYMNFTNYNVSLMGRFRKKLDNEAELLYGAGLGANYLKGNRVQISKRSDNEIQRIIEDSTLYNTATLPAVYLNLEYKAPLNSEKFSYGVGLQLQYIYMLDQGLDYRIDMIDKYGQYFSLYPQLTGQVLNPMVYVNLYYRMGR